ncbi:MULTISPECIES: corrinoid protein [Cloacibacillus]|uniref:cobalamin B12-binding domain-containing protein n=1 Tax=Cloacibacillus TaxID=508459 RepID=UPI0023EFC9CF|nr:MULTISPECIES: corrinoid protein [Cloacibacillus]MCC8057930.1 corrinoid protein [Cloacibacillus sp.]MDD7649514.1 corrinoid protein [Cloacibacillus porcorum]MDY4094515.1 corrinoid protein [Cloacibacillus porcorum]
MSKQEMLGKIIAALMDQDRTETNALVDKALENGVTPMEVLNEGLAAGLQELGVLFAEEEVFLPELLLAAEITTDIMKRLQDKFEAEDTKIEKRGTVLLATVEGDVHDIGKSLVGMIMNASGYNIIDAGKDVPNKKMIELVKEHKPDIVGLSSLLSTTMPAQQEFIEMAKEAGIRDQIKVIVGGAPVSRDWANKIGADGYAEDASGTVIEADMLLGLK